MEENVLPFKTSFVPFVKFGIKEDSNWQNFTKSLLIHFKKSDIYQEMNSEFSIINIKKRNPQTAKKKKDLSDSVDWNFKS